MNKDLTTQTIRKVEGFIVDENQPNEPLFKKPKMFVWNPGILGLIVTSLIAIPFILIVLTLGIVGIGISMLLGRKINMKLFKSGNFRSFKRF